MDIGSLESITYSFKPINITYDKPNDSNNIVIKVQKIEGTPRKQDKIKKENNDKIRNALKKHLIYQIISDIDNANSTHLNSDRIGRIRLTNRILKFTIKDFFENLSDPEASLSKEKSLYYELAKNTKKENDNISQYSYNGKRNPSFASKFLQSACFHKYSNDASKDNYSKYDNIVKKVLPYYAKRYGVALGNIDCSKGIENYKNFYTVIGEIINKAEEINNRIPISRNGFDHLLWYYYKGNLDETIEILVDSIKTIG